MEMEAGQGIRVKKEEEIIILVLCRSFSDMNDPNGFLMGPGFEKGEGPDERGIYCSEMEHEMDPSTKERI